MNTFGQTDQSEPVSQPGQTPIEPSVGETGGLTPPARLTPDAQTALVNNTVTAVRDYEASGKPLAESPDPYMPAPQPPVYKPPVESFVAPAQQRLNENTLTGQEKLKEADEKFRRLLIEIQANNTAMLRSLADKNEQATKQMQELLDNTN